MAAMGEIDVPRYSIQIFNQHLELGRQLAGVERVHEPDLAETIG
jgi:hypothetical protein